MAGRNLGEQVGPSAKLVDKHPPSLLVTALRLVPSDERPRPVACARRLLTLVFRLCGSKRC
jgi:hypothetical protein